MKSRAQVDDILKSAAADRRVAGVVAMAADDKGVIYEGAFGRRAFPDGAQMTLDTVFWIASMTKAITGVAAMQLVEQGKLALDRPAGETIAQLGKTEVIDHFDADGNPVLRAPKRPITLRNLLTHTSGFSEDVWHADMKRYIDKTGHPTGFTGKLEALNAPLIVDPDTRWEYGMGMDWVGQLIENASGKTLDVYFKDHIFDPLGMKDSSYVLNDEQKSRLAKVHIRKPDGALEPFERTLPAKREYWPGGGSLFSTASDYLTFVRMLLAGGSFNGRTLLKPETLKIMGQNHVGDIESGILKPARLDLSNHMELFPGIPKRWGLSFLINMKETPTGRSAGSLCWAGLGNTYYWLDPVKRVAGVLLTQVLPFADPTVLALLDEFETAIYAKG